MNQAQKNAVGMACGVALSFGALFGMLYAYEWLKLDTADRVAKAWCIQKDGVFDERFSGYPSACDVPIYKGAAGIKVGEDRYVFSDNIVNFDTGLTVVQARKVDAFETMRKIGITGLPDAPRWEDIGTFITKGKNN